MGVVAVAVSVRWHHVLAWKKSGVWVRGQALGHDGRGCVVMCGPTATPLTPLQRRVPISGSSADDGNDGSPEEKECKWAGGSGASSHSLACLSLPVVLCLVDKESERRAAE